jgi:hypothetical protein
MDAMTAPSNPSLRIGNDERDAAIKALDEHLNAGRLDAEEYGQRVAQASLARTRDGIDELFVDLPAPHPFGVPAPPPSWDGPAARPRVVADRAWRRFAGEALLVRIVLLVVAGIVVVVAIPFAIVGAVLFFVVFPLLGLGGWHHGHGRARNRRRWRY